jgi:hypothetical protein
MITGGEPAVDLALVWGAAKEPFSEQLSWQDRVRTDVRHSQRQSWDEWVDDWRSV